ncbi:MAG: mechanosensitive channel MscK, partial [Halomonas sp.]
MLLLCSVALKAATLDDVPDEASLKQRLDQFDSQETLNAQQALDQQALTAAMEAYERLDAIEQQLDELEERARQAPDSLIAVERELAEAENGDDMPSIDELSNLPLAALESEQAEALTQLQQLQSQLAEVNSQFLTAQTLPERAQQSMADTLERMESLRRDAAEREALLGDRQLSALNDARMIQLRLERAVADREVALYQRQLSANGRLRDLALQRRDLLMLQIERHEQRLNLLQNVIDRERRLASEQAIADAAQSNPLIAAGHPVVVRAQQRNQSLSLALLQAGERDNSLVRDNIDTQRQLEHVRQLQRSLNEQIEAIRGSQLLSRILREQRQSLPNVLPRRDLQDEIADLRLKQFDLVRQRDQLRQAEQLARQRLSDANIEPTPALINTLSRLYQSRRELVDELEEVYGRLLSAAVELQLNQQQLLVTTQALRNTIDEQLFWVANSRPLDVSWLRQLPQNLRIEWQEGEWRAVLPNRWPSLDWQMLSGVPFFAVGLLLVVLRRRIKAHLATLHGQIGRLKSDTQLHTPKAVFLNALLAVPGPLALAG